MSIYVPIYLPTLLITVVIYTHALRDWPEGNRRNKMTDLTKDYPELADFFRSNDKHFNTPGYDISAAICQALYDIEENGHHELPATHSITGAPKTYSPE